MRRSALPADQGKIDPQRHLRRQEKNLLCNKNHKLTSTWNFAGCRNFSSSPRRPCIQCPGYSFGSVH